MKISKENCFQGRELGLLDLRLENLVKIFGDKERGEVRAVDDISLTIYKGEFVTFLGPSGCGKTTLLRLLAGFEYPTSGSIYLGSKLMNNVPPNKRDMPMVFQSYALFPHLSVYDNIAYGLRLRKLPDKTIRESVEKVLQLINLLGLENRFPGQLSGGQQQRVALARALVMAPKVLLFDEPLSNLDAKLRVQMRDEIRRLQRRLGITSIYVTHDQAEAMSLSDRVAIMNNGRVEQIGTPLQIYRQPSNFFVADFIGKANFLKGKVENTSDSILTIGVLGHQVEVPNSGLFQKGDEVYLVIRPEAVRITDEVSGYEGQVKKATYLGAVVEYEVEIGNQIISILDYNPLREKIYSEGSKVNIEFLNCCFHLLSKK